MKNLLKSIVFISVALLISCGGNDTSSKGHRADFLPPMEIKVADELKSDAELVEVVKSSEKAINEFSDNIERLALDGKEYLQDDFDIDKASMMEKIKVGKLMLDFTTNSTEMLGAMQKFTDYVEEQQKQGNINDTQLKALEQVGKAFEDRINQINKKYEHYFDK